MTIEALDVAKTLKGWPSRNLEQLLDELSALGGRFRDGEAVRLPRVTVWLRSGTALPGRVIDFHQDRSGTRTLLLQSASEQSVDVTHVPFASIDAVTVHELEAIDRPPENAPIVTRERLAQRVATVSQALAQAVGAPLELELSPASDEELEPLDWLLRLLEGVLLDVVRQPGRAEAVRSRVKKVRLTTGLAGTLVFSDGVLSISTPLAWNKRTSAASLERELEALL